MILRFKPVEHFDGELATTCLRITNAANDDRIQRGELHFAILNKLHAFAQHLVLNEQLRSCFERWLQPAARHNAHGERET